MKFRQKLREVGEIVFAILIISIIIAGIIAAFFGAVGIIMHLLGV